MATQQDHKDKQVALERMNERQGDQSNAAWVNMMQRVTIPTAPLPSYLTLSSREAAGHARFLSFLSSSQRIQK